MNSKVNNWAVELEQFRLHLEWIPGSRNLLADSLSHLLDVVPDAQKTKEPDDQEFSSYCFEELEPAKVMETISTEVIELIDSSEYPNDSQKLQKQLEKPGVKRKSTDKKEMQDANSEVQEHSQNSRMEPAVETFKIKFEEKPTEKRTLLSSREFREHSREPQTDPCIEITEHEDLREIRLPLKLKLQQLQKNDTYCRDVAKKLHKDTALQKIFIKEEGVLYRLWMEDGRMFKCILVPQVL